MGFVDNIFARLSESLVINSAVCSRVRHKMSECDRCITACRRDAVSITRTGGKVLIDWDECDACGECLATCPNTVFSMKILDKEYISTSIKENIARHSEAVFTCRKDQKEGVTFINSLAYVNRKLLLTAACYGVEKIILFHGNCSECRYNGCMNSVLREIQATGEIFRLAGVNIEIIITDSYVPVIKRIRIQSEADAVMNRREFFAFIGNQTKKTVGKTIYTISENDRQHSKTILSEQQLIAVDYMDRLKSLGGDKLLDNMRYAGLLAEVSLDSSMCKRCGVCSRICPFNVFTPIYKTIKGLQTIKEIIVNENRCTGCGICILACMPKAIAVRSPY